MNYIITHAAERDMLEIQEYISADNKRAAKTLMRKFKESFRRLAELPEIGYKKPVWTDMDYRFWNVGKYIIAYEIQDSKTIIISRVLSSYRDIISLLE